MIRRMQGGFGREPLLTYEGYLKIGELLSLQQSLSKPPDRDELLFIIVHQVHELWFKLILWELDHAVESMQGGQPRRATHHVRRVAEIQRSILEAIHILETMSSADFLRFRDHLNPASGFQSAQFREIELLAGHKRESVLKDHEGEARKRLERRLAEPTLEEAFYDLLRKRGIAVPRAADGLPEDERRRRAVAALLPIYKRSDEHAEIFDLAEALVAMDEQLLLWRLHHVTMVERMIGSKVGTGGSSGVPYLASTTKHRAFPDLWALRTELTPGAY
ncbi:tryptophan 2,3-dioxygenase [bacterium]|nr:tryptophan 2,3-dioxygenase [bacterium]